MIKIIRSLLTKIINNIDAGNSNMTEEEAIQAIEYINSLTNREKRLSKYEACKYLNVSRATFDNYIKNNKIPRGKKQAGFKELSWDKKTLDEFIRKSK